MSKPSSGLFVGTLGAKKRTSSFTSKNNATQNHRHVVLWAEKKIAELESKSKRQRDKFNTATVVYDEISGKYYYGQNGGITQSGAQKNTTLFGDDTHPGLLPPSSLNQYSLGNCSEVDAINNALNDGASLGSLHITTIHTTKHSMGKPKAACENCTYAFKGKVKRNYSGWTRKEQQ